MKKLLLLLMIVPIIGFGQELELVDVETEGVEEELDSFDIPFISVEQMPLFGDCKDVEYTQSEIMKFISKNFKYPESSMVNGVEGRVILEFVVEECGHVDRIKILRGLDKHIDKAAIESIKLLPKFTPGKQFGKAVPVKYTVPIKCTLG